MKKINPFLLFVGLLPILSSCNIYKPFAGTGSTEDILDAALSCLHAEDYVCAIEKYNKLPDSDLKNERLCTVTLAKAGVTLNVLLNVVTQPDRDMLGALANSFLPWSTTRQTDIDSAKAVCATYYGNFTTVNASTKTLLKTLSLLSHCAVRMARTDTLVGDDRTNDPCTIPGNSSGRITAADIGSGGLSTVNTGMCSVHVEDCNDDLVALPSEADLNGANLTSIAAARHEMPGDLTNDATATDAMRSALADTVVP